MAITKYPPNKIHLGGRITIVNDLPTTGTPIPGYLMERYSASGTPKYRAHSTAGGEGERAVALDQEMLNRGVDDAYADGDLVEVGILERGATAWLLIASGQNLVAGDFLESAGNGLVRKYVAGVRMFKALYDTNNSAGPSTMRVKAEAL